MLAAHNLACISPCLSLAMLLHKLHSCCQSGAAMPFPPEFLLAWRLGLHMFLGKYCVSRSCGG